ncbi:hypothetical protein L218DRAFT_809021, partial [Marasmius fiardii PR-910]
MPPGRGGYHHIVQAIKLTILSNEAKALKELTSHAIARFIYNNLICCFACVPYLSMDGGSKFKGEVEEL